MAGKRKRHQRKHFNTVFALGKAKAEQMKGCDKIMMQKKIEYRREVKIK